MYNTKADSGVTATSSSNVEPQSTDRAQSHTAHEARSLRRMMALLRVVLGVILVVTWFENLQKGLYQPESFAGFINWLADGHPIGPYGAFLSGVVAAGAALFGPGQMVLELLIGLALLVGAATRLAGLGAAFFFFNLFLAYLNPNTGEWIWTYVLLVAAALVVMLSRSGREFGVDSYLVSRKKGQPVIELFC